MKKVWVAVVNGEIRVFAKETDARAWAERAKADVEMSGSYPYVTVTEKEVTE